MHVCPRCVLSSQFDSAAALEAAPEIPGYILGERLGRGGSGTVYHATQCALDRPVAIKFLREDASLTPARSERLRRESQSLARLQNPHILAVIDSGEVEGERYVVMELAPGGDLRGLMKDGPLPPGRVSEVICQAANALDHAHAEDIIHRDVKPENLLLDREGRIRLADFGLAASSSSQNRPRLTEEGTYLGTPGYMAPEQQHGDPDAVDHRADIFSLGCLAYEMLTGKVPSGQPALPSATSGVPKTADAVILKAMAAEPEARYQSAGGFAQALDASLQKRQAWLWAGLGIAGALLMAAAVFWGTRSLDRGETPAVSSVENESLTAFLDEFLHSIDSGNEESFFEFPIPEYYGQQNVTLEGFRAERDEYNALWPERIYDFVSPPLLLRTETTKEGKIHELEALFAYDLRSDDVRKMGQKRIHYQVLERAKDDFVMREVFEVEVIPAEDRLYWEPRRYEREQLALLERLRSQPRPLSAVHDGWETLLREHQNEEIRFEKNDRDARSLTLQFLAATTPDDLAPLLDDVVDFAGDGLLQRSQVLDHYRYRLAVWPEQWHLAQTEPVVQSTGDGAYSVTVEGLNYSRSPTRLRKLSFQRQLIMKPRAEEGLAITSLKFLKLREEPWTEEERVAWIGHFCEQYYRAGCAESTLSQLYFLNDPTFYVSGEKKLSEIAKSFESYHSLRPNRYLELVLAPEIAKLAEEHYLAVCRFDASREKGGEATTKTDVLQIRFFDHEPRIVSIVSVP